MPNSIPPNPPVTWNTVKLLFKGVDIAFMKMYGYFLDDYETVAQQAPALLGRLKDGSMPPKPFQRWSPEMIETFEAWIAGGFIQFDPAIADRMKGFLALSEFLTGFDDLHEDPELAQQYFTRLINQESVNNTILEELIAGFQPGAESQFENAYLNGDVSDRLKSGTRVDYQEVAKTVILLWYTGSFFSGGFPGSPGTIGNDQYISGLVWRAVEAHPMGYSAEGYLNAQGKYDHRPGSKPYWHFKPEPNGKHTGLGPRSIEP